MRFPVIGDISTKDGDGNKNARLTNTLAESKKNGTTLATVRPGLNQVASTTGNGNGLVCFNGELVNVYDAALGIVVETETEYGIPDGLWFRVAYGSGKYLAIRVGTDEYAYSSDGDEWEVGVLPAIVNWRIIVFNDSKFLAIPYGSTVCATSTNGLDWTEGTITSEGWSSVAWNGTVFCAVAGVLGETTSAATSTDGLSWTSRTLPASKRWMGIAWNGTVFCAVSGYSTESSNVCAVSSDGITWEAKTLPDTCTWSDICANGTTFCAVGWDYTNAPNTTVVAISTDHGENWTLYSPAFNMLPSKVLHTGSFYCAVGEKYCMTSYDGASWTRVTMPTILEGGGEEDADTWAGVVYGGSKLCAVGGNGEDVLIGASATSINGSTWSPSITRTYTTTTLTTLTENADYDFALIP